MKPKKVNYQIEEPCHADWDQMKPEAQGRFCSSCSKTVVDFSAMSDFSIVNYLENNKHQSVCGRFAEDQLDKTYLLPKQNHSPFQFDLKAVALGLALSTFSAIPSQAQTSTLVEQHDSIQEPRVMIQGAVAMSYDHSNEKFVSGKIKLDGGHSGIIKITLVDGSSVELLSVTASKNNTFKIPLDWSKNPASIRISAPGYGSETIYFSNHQALGNLTVTLHERPMIKGKVVRQTN
ncbi:hypothetical protein [Fluviicola chungangensis]|uniref:Carboxypeptidase regulatory-like domain-containing protein n=1 Tax=Fluviicola chungangensis TaxID=2597671 RepID=A0A556MNR9_9FLAO|nr:hypothetical protein [Fluviicola chungangensis]TSJ41546.1 hypothetical protein FO442_13865 [Fluviicola chungangensis]